ncbi:MAG: SH3 domain-containing protein [Gammaproteobacteria bacterium]|nr:SH3 domain-containing protein [Gammaproteobacteria bacterium]
MKSFGWFPLSLLIVLLSGCESLRLDPTNTTVVDRSAAEPAVAQDDLEALRSRLALRSREVAELRLQLLAKQAEINRSLAAHERALEEVVRTNAKLRSRDTRADTVSRIAEASLEIENARDRVGEEQQHTLEQAENLLESSREELDKGHFSSASYLADKALNLVRPLHALPEADSGLSLQEETRFATSLAMKTTRPSNVRERPERGARIRYQLERNRVVEAHAHSGRWIRISDEDGVEGWVYYNLLELVSP